MEAFAASTRLAWVVSLPITVTIFAFAGPIVLMIAGPRYPGGGGTSLRVLIVISSLSAVSFQFRSLLRARREPDVRPIGRRDPGLEGAPEVGLIPRLGYNGACVGSLIGEAAFLLAGLGLCRGLGIAFDLAASLRGAGGVRLGASTMTLRGAAWPAQVASVIAMTGAYPLLQARGRRPTWRVREGSRADRGAALGLSAGPGGAIAGAFDRSRPGQGRADVRAGEEGPGLPVRLIGGLPKILAADFDLDRMSDRRFDNGFHNGRIGGRG